MKQEKKKIKKLNRHDCY